MILLSFFLRIILLIIVLIAIGKMPYGYYEFLRNFVSMSSLLLLIYELKQTTKTTSVYFYVALILLFNPIVPFYFSKNTWILLDVLSVILICISFYFDSQRKDDINI